MSIKPKSLLCISLISALTLAISTPANGANPDDGYPQGVSAPGRTCPNAPVGDVVVSEITQKSLVCTLIDGQKKWWVKGEPLPVAPAASGGSTDKAPEIVYIPKYKLAAKALAKMKVYENVTYANKTATQHLDIYMPKGVVKPPLIVWTHGGGFVIGDDDFMKFDESAKLLEVFIKNGIAVASVNYRLSQEALFPAAGVDTKSAIRFLRANASKYGYDSKKFATGGDSAGSYLALMAAITADQPSPFDDPTDPNRGVSAKVSVVIDLFGNADFFEMTSNNEKYPCDQSKNPYPGAPGNINPWFGDTREDQSIVQDQSLVGKLRDVGTICVPWTDPAKYMCDMTYDLTNNSDEPVEINGFVFLRVDSRTYQADSSDQYSNATDYISATLNPGQTKWARTSFQVPTDGKIMQLWIGSLDLKKVVISIDALAETFDN